MTSAPDLRVPRSLAPAYARARSFGRCVFFGSLLLLGSGLTLGARLASEPPPVARLLGPALAAFALLGAVLHAVHSRALLRRTRWWIDERALHVDRGVVFQERIDVPRARVQHTDVRRGPIERRLGLSTLVVHTAGSLHQSVALAGLHHHEAELVRRWLSDEPPAAPGIDDLPGQALLFDAPLESAAADPAAASSDERG